MDPLSIISPSLPLVRCQAAYSEQMQAIGGTPPYTWTRILGSFPTGVSLSLAGLLSAALGAVPNNAVGFYSFRLQVQDAAAATAVMDYILEVAPAAYGRVPEFLLDNRLYNLVARYLLDTTSREKTELHFFRSFLAALGETFVHLDRDIKCEAWGGSDVSLRDALDQLLVATGTAVKTIEGILPDGSGNFDMVPGTGITLTPQPNGLMVSATSTGGPIDVLKAEAAVIPGGTMTLNLTTSDFLAELWVKTSGSTYNLVGNTPAYGGKYLLNDIAALSGGMVGMAVGEIPGPGTPVVHVAWSDGVNIMLARFDALTLELLEKVTLAPGALTVPPLVMVTADAKVVVAYMLAPQLFYGVLNPADYTDFTAPAYMNPPQLMGGGPYAPNSNGKLVGAVSLLFVSGEAYIGCKQAGVAQISYFDTSTPSTTGGLLGAFLPPGGGTPGDILDIVLEVFNSVAYVIDTDAAAPGNLRLWYFSVPFGLPSLSTVVLHNSGAAPCTSYRSAAGIVGASVPNPGSKAHKAVFLFEDMSVTPNRADLFTVYTDQVEPASWPPAPAAAVQVVRTESCNPNVSAFLKWWDGVPRGNDLLYVESTLSPLLDDFDGQINRIMFTLDRDVTEATTGFDIEERNWIVPAFTSQTGPSTRDLRIFMSRDLYLAVETSFSNEALYIEFDSITHILTAYNNSPFTWDLMLVAIEEATLPYPPNLMVACWQLAQALRNYFIDNSYYPSASSNPPGPGGVQGVIWSETEAGTTMTGGAVLYPTYYTVVPGTWDLVGGTVAQAEYYSVGAPGASLEHWAVFRYVSNPGAILAAEVAISAVVGAAIPAPGVYNLVQLDAIMGSPGWPALYSGAPYDRYTFFCFVDPASATYRLGWFSMNYIHDAQVFGPAPTGGEFNLPFTELFTVAIDQVPNVSLDFVISRYCRAAEVQVNGIEYYQGIDWGFGATMDTIEYFNTSPGGYVLHAGDRVAIKYYV